MIRLTFIFLLFIANKVDAASILLHKTDAVVWSPQQEVTGEVSGLTAEKVIVHHNGLSFPVAVGHDHKFSFQLTLRDSINKIWVEVLHQETTIVSDTLRYTLGYHPAPIVKPFAAINGEHIILSASIIENPYQVPLKFLWEADVQNPVLSEIQHKNDSIAQVDLPNIPGEYYYNLLVVAEEDSTWFRTLVTMENEKVHVFDIDADYPGWMKDAIVYQITPYNFVANGTYKDITAKLAELDKLGINTIWLQPVFKSSYRGQGYDVVDYLSLNPAFGTEMELQQLIARAKELGMRVLFDLVLNHTSIEHTYAKDRKTYGEKSHYYDYYQHQNDGKPYSSFYNKDEDGFMFYFWEDLVNLNYENEEVRRWILEVCKYWVRKFDIDGYRFDAIWGVNARMPSFAGRLRTELKSINPNLLLLAEDKGSDPEVFKLGYDAAYDWTADTSWVSQWSWEYQYHPEESHTIFNFPNAGERGKMLKQALFDNGGNVHRQFRFLENNDLPRFIKAHELDRTKMAAALLFSLPGIPMLYNGQEVGFPGHPYSTHEVFQRNSTIQSLDNMGLFSYYQQLIQLRKNFPALKDTAMQELPVSSDESALVAFHRSKEDQNFIVIINMGDASANADIDLNKVLSKDPELEEYWLKDVLTGAMFHGKTDTAPLKIPMEGYSVRWLLLDKEGETIVGIEENNKEPLVIYPNPSDGNITINLPGLDFNDMRVIDMRGVTVFEGQLDKTRSQKSINLNLPPTVYFLQIMSKKESITTKILIQ